jgi:hypothetical protein
MARLFGFGGWLPPIGLHAKMDTLWATRIFSQLRQMVQLT